MIKYSLTLSWGRTSSRQELIRTTSTASLRARVEHTRRPCTRTIHSTVSTKASKIWTTASCIKHPVTEANTNSSSLETKTNQATTTRSHLTSDWATTTHLPRTTRRIEWIMARSRRCRRMGRRCRIRRLMAAKESPSRELRLAATLVQACEQTRRIMFLWIRTFISRLVRPRLIRRYAMSSLQAQLLKAQMPWRLQRMHTGLK